MKNWQRRKGIMLCYPLEWKRLQSWTVPDVYYQPKLDGLRCIAQWNRSTESYQLLTSEGNELDLPHISEELTSRVLQNNMTRMDLDGEIYKHGWPFEQIISAAKRLRHPEAYLLDYHIFDCKIPEIPFETRHRALLNEVELEEGPIKLVATHLADKSLCYKMLSEVSSQGYEGIIVRHPRNIYVEKRSNSILKFKPKRSDEYLIIGTKEETSIDGEPKGTLGALEVTDPEGNVFSVGSGFTKEQRKNLWAIREHLTGNVAVVAYQAKTNKGVPRFPVIIEVKNYNSG